MLTDIHTHQHTGKQEERLTDLQGKSITDQQTDNHPNLLTDELDIPAYQHKHRKTDRKT